MNAEKQSSTSESLVDLVADSADYDPLEFIDGEDDEDWMDDDGLLLPQQTPPEIETKKRHLSVYSPEVAGSVYEALRDLVTTNAARRPVLLGIVNEARDGLGASKLYELVERYEADNKSVYDPVSYCRMLERAGAIKQQEVEEPEEAESQPLDEGAATYGIEYMTIDQDFEPTWQATEEGLAAYEILISGNEAREKLFGEDFKYAEVYLALMDKLAQGGEKKDVLVDIAEQYEVTKDPVKLGNYFIDVLEAKCVITWHDGAWRLTDLGNTIRKELTDMANSQAISSGNASAQSELSA